MNGRIYDPLIGRMLSADPFVQFAGNLQSYNRYSYVMNNPLTAIDPTGYLLEDKKGNVIFKKAGKPRDIRIQGALLRVQPGYVTANDKETKIEAFENITSNHELEKRLEDSTIDIKSVNPDANCFGDSFTNGKLLINEDQVPTIMDRDGYSETNMPRVGDVGLIKIKDEDGNDSLHVVKVTEVDANGNVTQVRDKPSIEQAKLVAPDPATKYFTNKPQELQTTETSSTENQPVRKKDEEEENK